MMSSHYGLFIDNQFSWGGGAKFASADPATGEPVWEGRGADKKDVEAAVAAARKATGAWSRLSVNERKEYLVRLEDVLKRDKDNFTETISWETGKPLWEARSELDAMINKVPISFMSYDERCAEYIEDMPPAVRSTRYKPIGVIAVLGPFNLPGHLPNGHIVPALLAGNTVVFKPSELAPGTGRQYADCFKKAGFPDGVFNMVQGKKETGMALVDHPGLNGLLFTGSYATGRAIHKAWGGQPEKMLALEMGGNNPLIVDKVEDAQAAAYITVQSAFITSGQRCVCARRLIVTDNPGADAYLDALLAMTRAVKIGAYTERPEPFMGPMISRPAADAVLKGQDRLIRSGGRPLLKGAKLDGKAMVSPGLIDVTGVKHREDGEIFGPLLQLIRVKNLDEAIREANNTDYGLAAGILADEKDHYERFLQMSRCGVVNWNRPTTGASSKGPFGGVGKSGNFRPSAYFASDYCSYPVATIEVDHLKLPESLLPGIDI